MAGNCSSGRNYGGCKVVFNVMNEAGVEIGSGLLHCTDHSPTSLLGEELVRTVKSKSAEVLKSGKECQRSEKMSRIPDPPICLRGVLSPCARTALSPPLGQNAILRKLLSRGGETDGHGLWKVRGESQWSTPFGQLFVSEMLRRAYDGRWKHG